MIINHQQFKYSDYIVYVDESGNTDLKNVDPKYPVFVLTFCVIKKTTYIRYIVPQFQDMKFLFFGHDNIDYHSYDIRQKRNSFAMLQNEKTKELFFDKLNEIISESSFVIISAVIKKEKYVEGKRDIYHHALQFCLERLNSFLKQRNQHGRITHIICESRGKKEDRLLKGEFHQILNNEYDYYTKFRYDYKATPMEIEFSPKGPTGLQIADLFGHPIGSHIINPQRENRAFDIIEQKIFGPKNKKIGLKVFP